MRVLLYYFWCTALIAVYGAPRSRTKNLPQTVFDQKQTGDYNIQLHLKDFQIIALLADDSLGALGDYDYNYDYSDFTVKPPSNATVKPTEANSTTVASSTTTSTTPRPSEVPIVSSTTQKPPVNTTEQTTKAETATPAVSSPPGRIKVQILEGPSSPNIVPSEDMGLTNEAPALGEVLHYRRCASGYSRDKKGRCRRVRRPGVPFDISRLASNLAAKFRQASSSESLSLSSGSESEED